MPQGILPFKYELTKKNKELTASAGLLLYLELFKALQLDKHISQNLQIKKDRQGYRDDQIIMALILLNLAGGESVSDIQQLESDEGFCRILKNLEMRCSIGRNREKIKRRWRKKSEKTVASPSSIFRYLANFHNEESEKNREFGKSFIPEPNEYLRKFPLINFGLIDFVQKMNSVNIATLDMDATLAETLKKAALFSYKGFKAYQPINVWWFEQELLLHTEFRDGNVVAGFEQLRILMESLSQLPEGVEEVYVRSDSAGYQHDLLKYCDEGKNERFGRIRFAIGSDVTPSFKESILSDRDLTWQPIFKIVRGKKEESGQEWAETCFVPNAISGSKNGLEYRYIAIREELEQDVFPCMEDHLVLPFPTIEMSRKKYKLTAIVTNLDRNGEEVIHWYRKRAGKSEEVHSIMKEDLAGGRFPSSDFGENAAWWWIMILSLNIHNIMKQFVLKKSWKNKRLKAIRFSIINIPARVIVEKTKEFKVRISAGHPSFKLLVMARKRIKELVWLPSG